ncbi:hypothetical protein D3C85_274640 [compost metagenome]
MKLIELLARELVEWPEGATMFVQDDDSMIKWTEEDRMPRYEDGVWMRFDGNDNHLSDEYVLASDYDTAIVTRADWARERARLKDREAFAESSFVLTTATEQQSDGPCDWRDRIHEIDDQLQALTDARSELVKRLADEGLMLCGRPVVHAIPEGMDDYSNWLEGDVCRVISKEASDPFNIGDEVTLLEDGDSAPFCCGDAHESFAMREDQLQWLRRP